jgi:hypothetical protein
MGDAWAALTTLAVLAIVVLAYAAWKKRRRELELAVEEDERRRGEA